MSVTLNCIYIDEDGGMDGWQNPGIQNACYELTVILHRYLKNAVTFECPWCCTVENVALSQFYLRRAAIKLEMS